MKPRQRVSRIFPGWDTVSVSSPVRLRVFLDGAHDGTWNMARDAELLADHQPGADPVLRVYRWAPPCVTIGYNQKLTAFASEKIRSAGFGLVRRPTGGRAILHANELTYAVVGTSAGPLFGNSLHDAYMRINQALLGFLAELGVVADVSAGESRDAARGLVCFHSAGRYEIRTGGRKIIGSAQRRQRGVFLQHGSILAGPEHRQLVRFLELEPQRQASELMALETGTTDLAEITGRTWQSADLDGLGTLLASAFGTALDLEPQFQA